MTVSDQYKADHRCGTCMAFDEETGCCYRHPMGILTEKSGWCCEHIPDEENQKELTLADLNEVATLFHEDVYADDW